MCLLKGNMATINSFTSENTVGKVFGLHTKRMMVMLSRESSFSGDNKPIIKAYVVIPSKLCIVLYLFSDKRIFSVRGM